MMKLYFYKDNNNDENNRDSAIFIYFRFNQVKNLDYFMI